MKFWIVTPSFNQLKWLKLCVASVADQVADNVAVHHHVQDACSTDGTAEWLNEYVAALPDNCMYSFSYSSEPDEGMYDAINRGWGNSGNDADVIAYLNCDEQYVSCALVNVAKAFKTGNRSAAVVFGDALVVDSFGKFICYRRCLPPTKYHSLVGGNLAFLTCSTFLQRTAWEQNQLFFNTEWKNIGDAVWGLELIRKRIRMKPLHVLTSVFTETGENLNLTSSGYEEKARWRAAAPRWAWWSRKLIVIAYRLRKLFQGGYTIKPFNYSIYTAMQIVERTFFEVEHPRSIWKGRM